MIFFVAFVAPARVVIRVAPIHEKQNLFVGVDTGKKSLLLLQNTRIGRNEDKITQDN